MTSMRSQSHVALLAPLFLISACGSENAAPDQQTGEATTESGALQTAEWGYEGPGAPQNWGKLSADNAACDTGTAQSPINLASATPTDLPDPQFNYQPTPAAIENKGHTLQVNYTPGSTLTVGDARYELAQFHFHTPGEHQLDGKEYPAELHLVHQASDGKLAVVGVFIEEGSANEALSGLWGQLPKTKGQTSQASSVQVNAADLLPGQRQHFLYAGSLTTPPCTEGVTWMVMDEPIAMSAEQIAALRSIVGTSNRPVQPLGSRQLRLDT